MRVLIWSVMVKNELGKSKAGVLHHFRRVRSHLVLSIERNVKVSGFPGTCTSQWEETSQCCQTYDNICIYTTVFVAALYDSWRAQIYGCFGNSNIAKLGFIHANIHIQYTHSSSTKHMFPSIQTPPPYVPTKVGKCMHPSAPPTLNIVHPQSAPTRILVKNAIVSKQKYSQHFLSSDLEPRRET